MKAYDEYMNGISVSDSLHRRFVLCATEARPIRHPQAARRYAAVLACLAVILLGVLSVPRLYLNNVEPIASPSRQPEAAGPAAAGPDGSEKQDNGLSSAAIIDGSNFPQTDSSYAAPSPGQCLYFVEVQEAIDEYAGTDAMLFLAIDIFTAEGQAEITEKEIQSEADRLSNLGYRVGYSRAWTYKGRGEKAPYTFLSGLFTVDELKNIQTSPDYGYAFRFAHNGDGSAVTADTSAFESPGKELDLAAAYANPDFGAYLPQDLPVGFAFEAAHRTAGQESNSLLASWHKGPGYIEWRVSPFGVDDRARITSVADTKNYDLSLYPIPRADSVPDDLRIIVNNPIFRIEDLTLEAVKARAYEADDAGDISGPRMSFGVLYGDVLVELSMKGAQPEAVFDMLRQIEK